MENPLCDYDGNDCCNISSTFCDDFTFEANCTEKFNPLLGDGKCHDALNIEECFYDYGDCCDINSIFGFPHCLQCICQDTLESFNQTQSIEFLYAPTLDGSLMVGFEKELFWGDFHCDDELNKKEFDFDGGDCCFPIPLEYFSSLFCTECTCYA